MGRVSKYKKIKTIDPFCPPSRVAAAQARKEALGAKRKTNTPYNPKRDKKPPRALMSLVKNTKSFAKEEAKKKKAQEIKKKAGLSQSAKTKATKKLTRGEAMTDHTFAQPLGNKKPVEPTDVNGNKIEFNKMIADANGKNKYMIDSNGVKRTSREIKRKEWSKNKKKQRKQREKSEMLAEKRLEQKKEKIRKSLLGNTEDDNQSEDDNEFREFSLVPPKFSGIEQLDKKLEKLKTKAAAK